MFNKESPLILEVKGWNIEKGNTFKEDVGKVKAMYGIDFVIGVTDKEAAKAEKYVHFNERIHAYLIKRENIDNDFNILLNSDPYRQTIIHTKEIPDLKVICEDLLNKYNMSDEREREIRNFAQNLKELCEEALQLKKHIYAIGD